MESIESNELDLLDIYIKKRHNNTCTIEWNSKIRYLKIWELEQLKLPIAVDSDGYRGYSWQVWK